MDIVIFDLEWNGAFNKKTESYINEIIEFGAVRLDEELKEKDSFQMIVRPTVSKYLCSHVRKLTSISELEWKNGSSFSKVYRSFESFCEGSMVMSWSKSDIAALASNLELHGFNARPEIFSDYVDLQKYCEDMLGYSSGQQLGLQPAAEMAGIDPSSVMNHRAHGDSQLSAECLRKLWCPSALVQYIEDASSDSFWERLEFRPYLITDADSPFIDRKLMFFNCPLCGMRAKKKSVWKNRFEDFAAEFICPGCGHRFTGKIQIKKKYSSVSLSKKILKKKVLTENPKQETEKTDKKS